MSTASPPRPRHAVGPFAPYVEGGAPCQELIPGDRLTQPEFHERYERYTDRRKFELIGGVVFMASPAHAGHARVHHLVNKVLGVYAVKTPGIWAANDLSTVLGPEDEVQPDCLLHLLPELGGASRVAVVDGKQKHLEGPPELVAEVAHSSRAIDLHRKRDSYQAAGVREYLVASVGQERVYWWALPEDRMIEPVDGVLRSEVFPGLWLEPAALCALDGARLLAVLEAGLASPEHARFAESLRR